jgi:predicted outer membrane repeat protein
MLSLVVLGLLLMGVVSASARTFTVNSTDDEEDFFECDTICDATPPGGQVKCTLRAAVDEANCTAANDVIKFKNNLGPIQLFEGEIEIHFSVTIQGNSNQKKQVINGRFQEGDGIFEVNGGASLFKYLRLEEGQLFFNGDGGCIDINPGNALPFGQFSLTVKNSEFDACEVFDPDEGDGGAIDNGADPLIVRNSKFTNNFADNDGGAIHTDDEVDGDDQRAVTDVKWSTFRNNVAGDDGGAMANNYSNDVEQTVDESTFIGNTADDRGGAIAHQGEDGGAFDGVTRVFNSVFKRNFADFGGALCNVSDDGIFDAFFQNTFGQGGDRNRGTDDPSGAQNDFCFAGGDTNLP